MEELKRLEDMDKAEMVKEYLSDCTHIFVMDDGDHTSMGINGKGGDILLLWGHLTSELCKTMELDGLKELAHAAFEAVIEKLFNKLNEED